MKWFTRRRWPKLMFLLLISLTVMVAIVFLNELSKEHAQSGAVTALTGRAHAQSGSTTALTGRAHAQSGSTTALTGRAHAQSGSTTALPRKAHAQRTAVIVAPAERLGEADRATYRQAYGYSGLYTNTISFNISEFKPREQFRLWENYNSPAFGPDAPADDRYLAYRCDEGTMSFCGGWDNRVNGALLAYVLANLTGRRFVFQHMKPNCDITNFIQPNQVDWEPPTDIDFGRSKNIYKSHDIEILDYIGNKTILKHISVINFYEIIPPRPTYVFFKGNLQYDLGYKCSKIYAQEMAWAKDLYRGDVKAGLFKRLFKLSGYLQKKMNSILTMNLPTQKHRLICAHVRMGRNAASNPNDSEIRQSLDNLSKLWVFLKEKITNEFDKVFVMSDSSAVIEAAQNQSFKDRLVSVAGPVVHVDKAGRAAPLRQRCDGLERVILEQHLLMTCDVLVAGHSGLSALAAYVRNSDQGLYCFLADGHIQPCRRDDLMEIFFGIKERTCGDLKP